MGTNFLLIYFGISGIGAIVCWVASMKWSTFLLGATTKIGFWSSLLLWIVWPITLVMIVIGIGINSYRIWKRL